MNRKKRFISNVSYNFLSQIWFMLLSLAVMPYIVHKLGIEAYAIYSVIMVVMGYLTILDLGFGAASIKYISDFSSQDDRESLSEVVQTSLLLYLIIGLVGALILSLSTKYLVSSVFRISKDYTSVAVTVFYIAALNFVVFMVVNFLKAILMGLQRFDLLVKSSIAIGTVLVACQVLLLYLGFGLIQLIMLNVAVDLISIGIFWYILKGLPVNLSLKLVLNVKRLKLLWNFSAMKLLNQISTQIVFQADRLLIGIFMPISWVTYYTVPSRLSQKLMGWQGNIANAYFPLACELIAKGEKDKLTLVYTKLIKYVLILVLPLSILIFVFSDTILHLWMHGDFAEKAGTTLKLLIVSYTVAALTTVPALTLDAVGKPHITAIFSVVSAIINLVAAIILIPLYGIEGAALAFAINIFAQSPLFLIYVLRSVIKVSSFRLFVGELLRPTIAGAVLLVTYYIIKYTISTRLYLAIGIVVGGMIYLVLIFLLKAIDEEDMRILKGLNLPVIGRLIENR
ncbi:MAG: flippase [Deltaproteobacteria bacterium]|nr:flippase [Deltaproteobacteria bacterium]MCL5277425.1 flippase [Deltaproteobacteria bacterium]